MAAARGLRAGRLRERVEIWRMQEVATGLGGFRTEPALVARVWAEVLGQPGREVVLERALQGVEVYRVTIRWREDVRQADELRWRGKALNVKSATDPEGRREQLVIVADTEAVRTAA